MFEAYAAQMVDYYTHRVDPLNDNTGEQYAHEWDRELATQGHVVRELAQEIQRLFAGRDVLELAAGMGRWTRPLLQCARSVLATDASPRVLARLAEGSASHGLEIAPDAFQPMKLNAFRPNEAPGLFNAALTVNWFQHIPRQILPQWIRRLHRKLVPGSIVMIGVNHLTARADHDCSPGAAIRIFMRHVTPLTAGASRSSTTFTASRIFAKSSGPIVATSVSSAAWGIIGSRMSR